MKYIIDQTAWQEACNGIRCRECSMLDETGACRIEEYIRRQTVHEERPHGEWTNKNIEFGGICWATCSVCKKISNGEGQDNGFGHDYFYPNFCPNCGADMRKESDEK